MAIIFICWQNSLNFNGNEFLLCKFLASSSVSLLDWGEERRGEVSDLRQVRPVQSSPTQWGLVICVGTFVVPPWCRCPDHNTLDWCHGGGGGGGAAAVSINVVRHNILSHQEFGGLLSTNESAASARFARCWTKYEEGYSSLILKLYFKSKHKQVKFIQMKILWKGQS